MGIAPAASARATAAAVRVGTYENAGQAAVVGVAARSKLSLMAKGIPYSGAERGSRCSSAFRYGAICSRVRR